MNKFQNINYIFLFFIITLFLCCPYLVHSQNNETEKKFNNPSLTNQELLIKADSLFEKKKYSDSYLIYKKIFDEEKSSPSMLLKMAFISEGFEDYGEALYFLNLYYLKTADNQVLSKMESLAAKHKLVGYDYSDADYFLSYYYMYQLHITFAVTSLVILILSIIYYQKRKLNKTPVLAGVFLVLVLAALFLQINFPDYYKKGIVLNSNAYLMRGPSSGADLVDVVQQGHRVEILGREDVWIKINWNGNEAFIRENNIKEIKL